MERLEDSEITTDSLEMTAFEYGFNSQQLRELLKYWKDDYLSKWNEREAFLNQFPQFITQIQGWVPVSAPEALKNISQICFQAENSFHPRKTNSNRRRKSLQAYSPG